MEVLTTGILVGFSILSLKKPVQAAGLLLAAAPAYLIRFSVFGVPTTLLELALLVFLLAVFAAAPRARYLEVAKKVGKFAIPIALFALAGIISAVISPDTSRALGQLKAYILEPIAFFFAVLLVVKTEDDLLSLSRWLLGGAVIISVFGLIQYFTGILLPVRFWGYGLEPRRISSFFEYPNALGLYLAPLSAFFLHLLLEKKFSPVAWFGWVVMVTALGLTFSRGGWLGFFVAAFIALALRFSFAKTFAVAALALTLTFISPITRERINNAFQDKSSSAHLALMEAGWNKAKRDPVFGNGLYGFRQTLTESNFQGEVLNYPHNIFLNFWLETGLLGLLSFLVLSVGLVVLAIKQPTVWRWAVCFFLITLWAHGQVDVPYLKNDLSLLYWFIVALALF